MSTRANIVLIHGAVGDQPGVRLGGDVPAEPVPPLRPGLAGVPASEDVSRVYDRDVAV